MTDYADYEAILAVIEHGIKVARAAAEEQHEPAATEFTAWCVLQELRRAGWSVARNPS
jgi:hypothetical protein